MLFDKPTSTVLLDKNQKLLNALIAGDGQWRFPHNDLVSEKFKTAIVEFEDHNYYSHIGVSARGIARAIKQNVANGKIVSGGSTITMQVIRMSRNKQRTIYQKLVEMIWATRLEAKFTKDEILSIYASNAPMGGNVVGLDAASWRYFQRSPDELSWAETATLAVLPNAPSLIHVSKNRNALKEKRDRLLKRLHVKGKIDKETMEIAMEEPLPDKPHPLPQLASHLLNKVISDKKIGQRTTTTLEANLQSQIINLVELHHQRLKSNNIFNAAVVVGNIKTGEIVSYVGNTKVKEKEHGGSVDVISSPRSSGSILKPFLYAFMLEDGNITPEQVIYDVPTSMAGYSPENYNQKYAGIVPANEALSKSLNVPFVRMLRDYGVQKFHSKLTKLGMATLNKPASHYGLSLILGGSEVKLIDLINMYAKMGRSVSQFPNYDTTVSMDFVYTENTSKNEAVPSVSPSAAWFTLQAMQKVVRPNIEKNWEEFNTSQRIAWKTGTSYGFRDAWAVGLNQDYVVGVWIGNADGEGRPGIIGVEAAAPLLFDVFDFLPKSAWFDPPFDELVKENICIKSGSKTGEFCEDFEELYIPIKAITTLPCSYHKVIFLDKNKEKRVTSKCYEVSQMERVSWFSLPPKVAFYYQKRTPNYLPIPPYKDGCIDKDELSQISILYPKSESKILITKTESGAKSQVIMEVIHRDDNAIIFWHLDDFYLGQTSHIHQFQKELKPGKHSLKVIDELGNSEKIEFEVVKD
ncbi:penicillin-binding protein 1C [Flavobacteriales bacterium]|nr:penicillin-binding protein 1C [Flavobacteriales bacterium]